MGQSTEEILIRLGLNTQSMQAGMASTQRTVGEWAKDIAGKIGAAFAVERVLEFAAEARKAADEVQDMSERLGVTVDAMQKLNFAAKATGTGIDEIANAMDRLAKSKVAASMGGTEGEPLVAAFDRFGITVAEIKKNTPEQLFEKIGRSMEKTGASAQLTADAMELLGKSGTRLIPMMKEFELLKNKAVVLPDATINQLAKEHKSGASFGSNMKAIGSYAVGLMSPFNQDTRVDLLSRFMTHPVIDYGKKMELERRRIMQETLRPDNFTQSKTVNLTKDALDAHKAALKIEEEITKEKEKQKYAGLTEYERTMKVLEELRRVSRDIKGAPYEGLSEDILAALKLKQQQLLGKLPSVTEVTNNITNIKNQNATRGGAGYVQVSDLAGGKFKNSPFAGMANEYQNALAQLEHDRAFATDANYYDYNSGGSITPKQVHRNRKQILEADQKRVNAAFDGLNAVPGLLKPEQSLQKSIDELQKVLNGLAGLGSAQKPMFTRITGVDEK